MFKQHRKERKKGKAWNGMDEKEKICGKNMEILMEIKKQNMKV